MTAFGRKATKELCMKVTTLFVLILVITPVVGEPLRCYTDHENNVTCSNGVTGKVGEDGITRLSDGTELYTDTSGVTTDDSGISSYTDESGMTIYSDGRVSYTDEKGNTIFSDGSNCHLDSYGETTCEF